MAIVEEAIEDHSPVGPASAASPEVQVILPGRAFSGPAEEVSDAGERFRVLPQLRRSMVADACMAGMGNPWPGAPAEIARKCEGMPPVRIRAPGTCAGPEDPGGRYWLAPVILGSDVRLGLLRRRSGPMA